METSDITDVDDTVIVLEPYQLIENLRTIDREINDLLKEVSKKKVEKDKFYKQLDKYHKKYKKNEDKWTKKKNSSGGGGLSVPYQITPEMTEFLSLEDKKYSRGEITSILTEYIKTNDLRDEKNTKLLKFNKKSPIFKILKVKEDDGSLRNLNDEEMKKVTAFGGINKYIQHHYIYE
jgi:chromatin remodeling complex protein RSC6